MCGKRWKYGGRCNSFIYHVMINVGVNVSSPSAMKKKKPSTPVVRMTSHNAENIILLLEHLCQQFSDFIII